MFISYVYTGKFKEGIFLIKDYDFQEQVNSNSVWEAIINVYEKRKLNVSKNLALSIIFYMKDYFGQLNDIITFMQNNCSKYKKYEKETQEYLEKYLILL